METQSEVVDLHHQSVLLKEDLLVQVKENLNISHVRDTEITQQPGEAWSNALVMTGTSE